MLEMHRNHPQELSLWKSHRHSGIYPRDMLIPSSLEVTLHQCVVAAQPNFWWASTSKPIKRYCLTALKKLFSVQYTMESYIKLQGRMREALAKISGFVEELLEQHSWVWKFKSHRIQGSWPSSIEMWMRRLWIPKNIQANKSSFHSWKWPFATTK